MDDNDKKLCDRLKELDNSDIDVTGWEAKFIESVAYKWIGPLTNSQRSAAIQIIEKYKGKF